MPTSWGTNEMNKPSSTHEMNKPSRAHQINKPSSAHQRYLCGSLIFASWHIHDGIPTRPPKDSSKAHIHTNTHTHIHTYMHTNKHVNIQSYIIMKVLQRQQEHTYIHTYIRTHIRHEAVASETTASSSTTGRFEESMAKLPWASMLLNRARSSSPCQHTMLPLSSIA